MRVLVVEDDAKLRALLDRGLGAQGFVVDVAGAGAEGLWKAQELTPDAVVLDVGLPDLDGFELCRLLRAAEIWVPVLMLTARDDVHDRVRGLDVGADDYLVKPFAFDELAARLRALLRRGVAPRPSILQVGDLMLDPATREVRRGSQVLSLTAREHGLLEFLMRRAGCAVSRAEIAHHVWDEAYDGDLHVVSVYIAYVRDKIDRPFGRRSLQTVRGAGYRLLDDHAPR